MKSKGVAYLLLIFLGGLGAHCFYLGKFGKGIIYMFTLGLCGIGLIYDLFTLGHQVDVYNAIKGNARGNNNANTNTNMNNITINMPPQYQAPANTSNSNSEN